MSDHEPSDCAGDCVLARRAFLRDVTVFAAGLVAAGLAPRSAAAAPTALRRLASGKDEARYPIPAKDSIQFDKDNEVILVRNAGKVYAFALSCPHQNTALKEDPSGTGFQCPKHKSKYKPDGEYISGRATRNMDRYAIRRDAGVVVVTLSTTYESDSEPTQWAGAVITV